MTGGGQGLPVPPSGGLLASLLESQKLISALDFNTSKHERALKQAETNRPQTSSHSS